MIQLSQSELQKLATESNYPCISIYMPAEKAGAETRKNSIRFKNLLSEAAEKVAEMFDKSALEEPLQSAETYIENYDFWQHQDCGLAFFIDRSGVKYYRLPSSFAELVVVGDRFHLKPILPVIANDSKFYLLALSQNQVRFFFGSHYSINEIKLPENVPPSLAEALKYDDPEKQTQFHTGDAGGSPIYHGQGVGTTDNKDEIKRFFDKVDDGLKSVLQEENTPLILAGAEFLLPIYQEANSYNNLLEEGVIGNPENKSAEELHQQAWSIIEPLLVAQRKEAIDQYYNLSGTGEATQKLEEIVPAAVNGQIDTLFVRANTQKWGKFEQQENKVTVYAEKEDYSVDLLDLAATNTFFQGGKIYVMDEDKMPEDTLMMAILRYPIYAPTEKVTV